MIPKYGRAWQGVVLPSKKKNLVSPLVTQIILILAFCCNGMLSQQGSSFTLTVARYVTVQRNSCVHIGCQFTYQIHDRRETLSAYWFKIHAEKKTCQNGKCIPGFLVATTNGKRMVEESAKNRFHFIGDPNQGNCSLIIMNAKAEDEGEYFLRIEGNRGLGYSYVDSSGYTQPSISLKDQPRDVQITWSINDVSRQQGTTGPILAQEGDAVKLVCAAESNPDSFLNWKKGNNVLPAQSGIYMISQIKPEDTGEYQCQAKNQFGSAGQTILVTVQYSPRNVTFSITRISRRDPDLSQGFPPEVAHGNKLMAQEGESLRILCQVDSNPSASTHWINPSGKTLKHDSLLELTELTVEDEGGYVCHAENIINSAQKTFQLYVAYAPKLTENPQRNATCWHQDNSFFCHCSFMAQPPPQVQWQVDGETITEKKSNKNQKVTSLIQKNVVTSTLNWTGNLEVEHNIVCIGHNSFGTYRMQLPFSALGASITTESYTGNPATVLISGLCGALLGVGFFMLGLCLLKFYRRKSPPKASCEEMVDPTNSGYLKPNNNSLIYSNILPIGQRTPHVGQLKTPRQKNVKQEQIPKVPDLTRNTVDEVHYAALEFKNSNLSPPIAEEETVEYSAVRRK
ncbi:sialic acid-binding Ig-like lectin 10 [Anolis carolinensis]|uniref:sialic acid-binding Ig-like lectin 10 n=1 Tax=Anolis carolinensis TaxID=28377 RepID=UPI002F2B73C2